MRTGVILSLGKKNSCLAIFQHNPNLAFFKMTFDSWEENGYCCQDTNEFETGNETE